MAVPETAVEFEVPLDPQEWLDYVFDMITVLETGEGIDTDPVRWSLVLSAEAIAYGIEIIDDEPDYPDPGLIDGDTGGAGNTAIRAWLRVDQELAGDAAFQLAGTAFPIEATGWTDDDPARKRQRTFLLRVKEQ